MRASRHTWWLTLAVSIFLSTLGTAALAQAYSVRALDMTPTAQSGAAEHINDAGQVAGDLQGGANFFYHGFYWSEPTGTVDIGTIGGSLSRARVFNNQGTIAGESWDTSNSSHLFTWTLQDGFVPFGVSGSASFYDSNDAGQLTLSLPGATGPEFYIWSPNDGFQALTSVPGGEILTYGINQLHINNQGRVAGAYSLGGTRFFTWAPGESVTVVNTSVFSGGSVFDINEAGQFIGVIFTFSGTVAFVASKEGGLTQLPGLHPSIRSAYAYGINASGAVVGQSYSADPLGIQAFYWTQDAGMVQIPLPDGHFQSFARDINDAGQVIGTVRFPDGSSSGFVWTANGGTILLPDLGDGWAEARAINASGAIAGVSRFPGSYQQVPVIWTTASSVPSSSNTPPGPGVSVTPEDTTTGAPAPISLTFDNVTGGGDTTVTSSGFGQGPPTDYVLGFPPVYYDITTTAQYTGSVEVCITYDDGAFFFENNLKLFHNEDGVWQNVTTFLDTAANVICGDVTSLSPFAVFEQNGWPTAVIADPGQVTLGLPTVLDGTRSSDPEGEALTFKWGLKIRKRKEPLPKEGDSKSKEEAAKEAQKGDVPAELLNADTPTPTFIAYEEGDYTVVLSVSDGLSTSSTSVLISVSNMPPTADAGPDQAFTTVPTPVTLDGSGSSDPEGGALTFKWGFVSVPEGSLAILRVDKLNPALATFEADVAGDYEVQLVVIDELGFKSKPDTVLVSYSNVAPVADAGPDRAGVVGHQIALAGSGTDANGDALTFSWALTTVPEGSLAALAGAGTAAPSFSADLPGTYVAQLIVSDGALESEPDTTVIEVITVQDAAMQTLSEAVTTLGGFPDRNANGERVFKSRHARRNLARKLLFVLHTLEHHHYTTALQILKHDVERKVDGCAERGDADRSDWIRTCDEQIAVYNLVTEAIGYVAELPHHRSWHRLLRRGGDEWAPMRRNGDQWLRRNGDSWLGRDDNIWGGGGIGGDDGPNDHGKSQSANGGGHGKKSGRR